MKYLSIASQEIKDYDDILLVRQKAREIAKLLLFDGQDQTRIAAAVSEIARDLIQFSGGGTLQFRVQEGAHTTSLELHISGNDVCRFEHYLKDVSALHARTGMQNARRLMDSHGIETAADGSQLAVLVKSCTAVIPGNSLKEISFKGAETLAPDPALEIDQLNRELVQYMEKLNKRQEELQQLTLELEETNRGVVALYAELDEKAEQLKQADELKSRFLSNMSHEFRTPLNSIMGLGRLLLDRTDGELTAEQEKQVRFIMSAAQGLTELVNDLLDIAKIEAGKTEVTPAYFTVNSLFGALRGMFRPLQTNPSVNLRFNDASSIPIMFSDEAKISQILRNYISNALKFTESGEIRVSAELDEKASNVIFFVSDTGIGIAPEQQENLFKEFSQLDSHLQRRTKGSGLGLALSRKLAELLGGQVSVRSNPGEGSTFYASVPLHYVLKPDENSASDVPSVLVIDDDDVWRYLVRGWFGRNFALLEARNGKEGLKIAEEHKPDVILLDLNMPEMNGFEFLNMLRANSEIAGIPVIVSTSKILDESERIFLIENNSTILSKEGLTREEALRQISKAVSVKET